MAVLSFEGVIEKGCVRLPRDVHLPDRTRVYVVVPHASEKHDVRVPSPRLADPADAADFRKDVTQAADDALRR